MSQLKKALQQLAQHQEFYAENFLTQPLYHEWQKKKKANCTQEFTDLLQAEIYNEERLSWFLKKQPSLVKIILHRDIVSQIQPWYHQHPSWEFKRQKRQHAALVDTLYILCARYKKQLRHLILTASQGTIGVSLESQALSENTSSTQSNNFPIHLTAAQHQSLKRALKHYQTTLKLEKTLMGAHSAQQKLYQFMQAFYAPETQAAFHQHRPFGVMKLFKKLFGLFQFEAWLASKSLADNKLLSLDERFLTELTKQTKKIVF